VTSLKTSLLVLATVGSVLAAALWYAERLRYAFLLVIAGGKVFVRRGKATAAFLEQVRQVCSEHGVHRGWIGGVREARRIRLVFSRSLSPACQQRVRNIWRLIGWGDRPPPDIGPPARRR
jgi:hypothetical protein